MKKIITVFLGLYLLVFWGCANTPEPAAPESPVAETPSPEDDVWSLLEQGEIEKFRPYFQGKMDVNTRDSKGRTPLHIAAEVKSPEMAAFFIALGAEVDAEDNQKRTPLCISAEKLDGDTAKVLVGSGADIHHPIGISSSPAVQGVESGGAFLESLLTPASLKAADHGGRTILHHAALRGKTSSLETVLKAEPPVNQRDRADKTALDLALESGGSKASAETSEKLILAGGTSGNAAFPYFAPAARNSNYDVRAADGNTLTHYAAGQGYAGYILFLLDKKADLNIKNAAGSPPLHEAARGGHVDVVKLLITSGADPNIQDSQGNTALHLVLPSIVQREGFAALLAGGADPNLRDKRGDTPLHIAIMLNRPVDIVQLLLEKGAEPSARNMAGKTPLHVAVQEERSTLITPLIKFRPDILITDNNNVSSLELALREHQAMLPLLFTPETVAQNDSAGNTVLHIVVKYNSDPAVVTMVLNNNAPINARNNAGDTPLHLAVVQNAAKGGGALLTGKADIFALNSKQESPLYLALCSPGGIREWMLVPETMAARDNQGNSILHYAAQWRLDSRIPLIVEKGASIEAVNATGETPLFAAVKIDSPSTIRALLQAGASVSKRDSLGNSALHAAVKWNAPKAAETVITSGVEVNSPALNGKTPLHDAVRLGVIAVENVLFRYGADFEVRDKDGNTPLMDAVLGGSMPVVIRLIDRGADPTVRNNRGDTPLHITVGMERNDLTVFLLGKGVSIHAKNSLGKSPFQLALNISPGMVSTLLTRDRITAPDDDGQSPLHIAVQSGASIPVIQIILDRGARLSAVDSAGRTPLRLAVDLNRWEIAGALADAGSNPFAVTEDGKNPADIVISRGEEAPIRAIFSGRALSARDSSGNTILHYAAKSGNPNLVNLLLSLNANKELRNIAGESPADVARRWNKTDIAELL